ncbi:MAG: hypothetical protein WC455_29305 [Dehalococcoidia bacterium]|jgi:hypothetical protein
MAQDYNPDREGHVPHKYVVVNATKTPKKFIEAGGKKLSFNREGFMRVSDPGVANEIRQKYGGDVTVSRVRNQGTHERGIHNYFFAMPRGLPWKKYDELGRLIKE